MSSSVLALLMGRSPRFIPESKNGVLVEVTCRTIGARALLTPGPNPRLFNEVVVGVLGRALEVSPLELCCAVFAGNHYHLLLTVRSQQELSRFMHHLGCNLSKEVGTKLRKWRGAFWERRYDAIVVSGEPAAQWRRLKYLLSHGAKEGLVESPLEWPGVHSASALVHGEKLEGLWFNRTKEWAARQRGLLYGREDFATCYRVGFAPLPAFRGLSPESYQDKIAELIGEIEEECAVARGDHPVAGVDRILNQNPYEPPTRQTKRSAKPLVHTSSREARVDFKAELDAFLAQYWSACEALRGDRSLATSMDFPSGCYPPALAFVGEPAPSRPPVPPTRRLVVEGPEIVERGAIPVVETAVRFSVPMGSTRASPRARGQPP